MTSSAAIAIGAPNEFWITQWKLGSSDNPVVHRAGIQEVKQHLCGRKKKFTKKSLAARSKSSKQSTPDASPTQSEKPTENSGTKILKKSSNSIPSSPASPGQSKRKRSASTEEPNGPSVKKANLALHQEKSKEVPSNSPLYPVPSEIPLTSSHSSFPQVPIPQQLKQNIRPQDHQMYVHFLAQQQYLQSQMGTFDYLGIPSRSFSDSRMYVPSSDNPGPQFYRNAPMWDRNMNFSSHFNSNPVHASAIFRTQMKSAQFPVLEEETEFPSFLFVNQDHEQWSSGEEDDLSLSSSSTTSARESRSSSWDHLEVPFEFFNPDDELPNF